MHHRVGLLLFAIALMAINSLMFEVLSYVIKPMFIDVFDSGQRGSVCIIDRFIMAFLMVHALRFLYQRVTLSFIAVQCTLNILQPMLRSWAQLVQKKSSC
ncbi:MAG: subfamily B ATP-binding cassette protein MsbA [Alteromonas macleodii]